MARVKIFGDSILQGVVFSDTANRYKLRNGNKYERLAECGFDIENHSRMGATISNGINAAEKFCNDCNEDTIVLFEFGGNDCDYNWKEISNDPEANHMPKTDPEKFVETYERAINMAKSKGFKVAVASLVPIDAQKYMKWITRDLNYENILGWLGDVSMLSRWHEYYSRMTEALAAKLDCVLIDFRHEFLLSHEYKNLMCTDGVHPTQRGYEILENILKNRLTAAFAC